MGRLRTDPAADPSIGKPLPDGVQYRGPQQYWARKLVNGKRAAKTFDTARKAGDWLKTVEVDTSRGVFVDTTEADKHKLGNVLRSYQLEVLADDPERVLTDREGKVCLYRPMRPVLQPMPTELLGAEREVGFIDVILRDAVCAIRMASLTGADMAQFRNRMKVDGCAPSSIVRRLNLIARAIGVARLEWRIHIPTNPADAKRCARPKGADVKRDRVLLPAPKMMPPQAPAANVPELQLPVLSGEVLPPFAERDDFMLGEEERLLRSCALAPTPAPDPWLVAAAKLAIATAMRQARYARSNGRISTSMSGQLPFWGRKERTVHAARRTGRSVSFRCLTMPARFS